MILLHIMRRRQLEASRLIHNFMEYKSSLETWTQSIVSLLMNIYDINLKNSFPVDPMPYTCHSKILIVVMVVT